MKNTNPYLKRQSQSIEKRLLNVGLIFLSFVSVFAITVNAISSVNRGAPFLDAHLISTLSNYIVYLLIYFVFTRFHLKKIDHK